MRKKVIILIGIPCSGKSTWARSTGLPIISRDTIREDLFEKKYKQNQRDEISVNREFNLRLSKLIHNNSSFIVDNTNCKRKYINDILDNLPGDYICEFKLFPITLRLAYYRNIVRWIKTGKFIPFKVIKNMHNAYNSLEI